MTALRAVSLPEVFSCLFLPLAKILLDFLQLAGSISLCKFKIPTHQTITFD